jgi:polysaccharide pyruvyl transferase WcaK-like protein
MKISIVGWYGMKNVGDEAFRAVLPQFFTGNEIEFVTPPNTCNNPDIVVLGGGAVAAPFYLDILPDCPRYALGIDIAYESEIDLLAKYNFKGIFVRNSTDIEVMKRKISCPVEAIPDLAFLLTTRNSTIFSKYKQYKTRPTVGVLVTDYVNPAIDRDVKKFAARSWSFQINLAKELDALQSAGYEVMLIPCATGGYGDDRRMNLGIAAFMQTKPTNIMDTLSPQSIIDLIDGLDVSLCMRFHAHVFSVIAGTPFLSIDYTRKVELLLKESNLTTHSVGKFQGDDFNLEPLLPRVKAATSPEAALPLSLKLVDLSSNHRRRLYDVMQQVQQEWLQ